MRALHGARTRVAGVCLAVSAVTGSADVQLLPWRRAVEAPPVPPGAWLEIWDDEVLSAGTQADFADIRFIDATGVAQPFTRHDPVLSDAWDVPLPQRVVTRDRRTVVVADLAGHASRGLVLRAQGFEAGAQFPVEASDDSLTWRSMGTYGIGPQPQSGVDTIELGTFDARWVRVEWPAAGPPGVTVAVRPDGSPAPALAGQHLEWRTRRERKTAREPVRFRVGTTRFDGRTWVAELEVEGAPMALCRLVVTPRAALAQHAVRVEGRLEAGGWRQLGMSNVETVPQPNGALQPAGIEWDPFRTSALRIHVENADAPNPPVAIDSLLRTPIRFGLPAPAGECWIVYGDAHVLAAQSAVDFARTADTRFVRAQLGIAEPNPFHRPPGFGLAWLQRRPAVLAVLLVLVLAAVAIIVLRPSKRA